MIAIANQKLLRNCEKFDGQRNGTEEYKKSESRSKTTRGYIEFRRRFSIFWRRRPAFKKRLPDHTT